MRAIGCSVISRHCKPVGEFPKKKDRLPAGGAIWSVASSGGEARKITAGESAIMEPSGTSLVVGRSEPARIRLFHVRLDGGPDASNLSFFPW